MQCQTNDDIELDVIEPPVVPSQLEFVSKRNSKYTSKTIQNDIMQEKLTGELRSQNLPFTIIADECTDSHSNQEILSICVRFVNLSTPNDPHIKEYGCKFSFTSTV